MLSIHLASSIKWGSTKPQDERSSFSLAMKVPGCMYIKKHAGSIIKGSRT